MMYRPALHELAVVVVDRSPRSVERVYVAGDSDTGDRVRDWVLSAQLHLTSSPRQANVLLYGPDQPLPRRTSDSLTIAVVDEMTSANAYRIRASGVDGVLLGHHMDNQIQTETGTWIDGDMETSAADVLLNKVAAKPRLSIGTSVRFDRRAELWGDTHFGRDLSDAMRRLGWSTEVADHSYLRRGRNRHNDALIYLRGLRPRPTVSTPAMTWIISHPDLVASDELTHETHIFAAGAIAAERFNAIELLQATNQFRFSLKPTIAELADRLLFVGNSRKDGRCAVDFAIALGVPLTLIGRGWESAENVAHLGTSVSNDLLPNYYSSAHAVLNDHWPDMASHGMVSNRVFDAAACGAIVLSDNVHGIADIVGPAVLPFTDQRRFASQAKLATNADLADQREQTRRNVVENHTFDKRAATLDPLLRSVL